MEKIIPTIISLNEISESFPNLPLSPISRENYITHIESLFSHNRVICIKGVEEGVGVTTLLALFARKHSQNCITLFNNQYNTAYQTLGFIEHTIAKQLNYFLYNEISEETEGLINRLKWKANRKLNNSKNKLYFLFDGYDSLSIDRQNNLRKFIEDLVTIPNSFFLFSGSKENVQSIFPKDISISQVNILPFSESETNTYFCNEFPEVSKENIAVISKISKGNAARMSILKYKLKETKSVEEYLLNDITENTDLLEDMLLEITNSPNPKDVLLFALLTYSEIPLSLQSLSSIMNLSDNEVSNFTSTYDHLLTKSEDGTLSIKSNILHKYLKKRLINNKRIIIENLVSHITKFENINQSFHALPNLLKEAHNARAILEYIDSNVIQSFVKKEASQSIVNEHCDLGFIASSKYPSEAIDRAFRYTIFKNCSKEIEKNELWDSEIDALLAIGEYEEACALAQNVYLKEEQLKCFLIIARKKEKLSANLYDTIIRNINHLIKTIDFEHIPNKSIELAKLLLPIDINQALSIIERVEKASKGKFNFDKLYSALSLSLEEATINNTSANKDVIQSKISDKNLRQLSEAMRKIFGNCDEERLIEELDKLSSDFHRLYLLQHWIPEHKDLPGIGKIIIYALKIVIRISDINLPKAGFVKQICSPLPSVSNECLEEIIPLLDSLHDSITTPSGDFVEIQIALCKALFSNKHSKAELYLMDLYFFIDAITDLSVKIHCWALLLASYDNLGEKEIIENTIDPSFEIQKTFNNDVDILLEQSAYHLHAVDGAIRSLAVEYPTAIKETISKLNTLERRSRAYFIVCEEYLNRIKLENIDWNYLFELIQNISYDKEDKDIILTLLVRKLYRMNNASLVDINIIKRIIDGVFKIDDDDRKIYTLTLLWVLLCKQYKEEKDLILKIKSLIEQTWESIDVQWLKINIGFLIVKYIAQVSVVEAKDFLFKVVTLKKDNLLSSASCISAYMDCMFLYTQSLGTLIRSKLIEEKHITQFQQMVDYLNSKGLSIVLWSKIALEYLFSDNKEEYNNILSKYISVSIDNLSGFLQKYVLLHSAAARYLTEGTRFLKSLSQYGDSFKNICIDNISKVILYKSPYIEYFDSSSKDFKINNDDVNHLCQLMLASNDDCYIFNTIEIICRSFEANKNNFSEEQKKYLWEQLVQIIDSKLPAPNGIQHMGYKIACKCCLLGLAPLIGKQVSSDDLLKDIQLIPNVADKTFLYFELAKWVKKVDKSIEYMREGYDLAQGIYSLNDKLSRLGFCLEIGFSRSRNTAKSLAKKTIEMLNSNVHGTFSDVKGLIDLVNQYDSDFTDELLDIIDTDTSRRKYRKQLEANISSSKKIEAASKNYCDINKLNSRERGEFYNQQLEGLISSKGTCHDPKESLDILKSIYDKPIEDTYKAILVFMENVSRRHKVLNKDGILLTSIHNSLFSCLQIILSLASGTKEKLEYISRIMSEDINTREDSIIRFGEKDKAIQQINEWYRDKQPVSMLRIVDAYFSPSDLQILKPLFDYNNDLVIKILTHKTCDIDEYQAYWNRISTDLTGMISIYTVNFKEKPDQGPIHDRWWIVNDEDGNARGIAINSVSGLGKKESGIYNLSEENIREIERIWEDYVSNTRPRINGVPLIYDSVQLK